MDPQIIFQNEHIIVLNKPAGWITNDSTTTGAQPVIQNYLRRNLSYQIVNSHELRSGIVHRLDKETSGVLVVAKNKDVFVSLQGQFKERKVQKSYLGLVHGFLDVPEGKIEVSVGRLPWRRDRFGVLPGGRDSITLYKVTEKFVLPSAKNQGLSNYSLVEFFPKTGRTHQIRIHAKHLGHPIVADEFYAGRKTARRDRVWCPRLFLHAYRISFHDFSAESQKMLEFRADLPGDLNSALSFLTKFP